MKLVNVLQRLAELDAGNPNVVPATESRVQPDSVPQLPDLTEMSDLRSLSGLKPIAECGIMPMGEMGHQTPASFSINASAASGDEVAGMLSQIMNLAGVHQVGQQHMPGGDIGQHPLTAEPAIRGTPAGHDEPEIMRSMIDKLNDQPEDEGEAELALGEPGADELGTGDEGPVGGLGAEVTGPGDEGPSAGGNPAMQSMADEIRGMADKLASIEDKDELNMEDYDNTPNSATDISQNEYAYQPNNTQVGNRMDGNMPKGNATFEDQLMDDYKKFVSEAKGKCCCEEKSKAKCPVHGKMDEAEEKTMSKAAKGMMKYGKQGMNALADAGKKGKDLEPVRAKYNKYD